MTTLTHAPWLAVVVPFALAGLLGLFGRFAKPAAPVVASLGPVLVIALGIGSLAALPGGDSAAVEPWTSALASQGSMTWFKAGETSLSIGWAVDSLAAIMLLVVGVVALDGDGLLGRVHGGRPRMGALLRAAVALHGLDDAAGHRRLVHGAVRRLGARRCVLVPPDRVLVREADGRRRRDQGVSHHARR